MFPWPYTNLHEINIDWILDVVKTFQAQYTQIDQKIADALEELTQMSTVAAEEFQQTIQQLTAEEQAAFIAAIDAHAAEVIASIPQDYSTLSNEAVSYRRSLSSSDDLDDLTYPGMYSVTAGSGNTWKPAHWPLAGGGNVVVFGHYSSAKMRKTQIIFTDAEIRYRTGTSGQTWDAWNVITMDNIDNIFLFVNRLYDSDDMDILTRPGMYSVTHDSAANWKPAHWPFDIDGGNVIVFGTPGTSLIRRTQVIFKRGELWYRMGASESTWTDWVCVPNRENSHLMVQGAEGLTGSIAERLRALEILAQVDVLPDYYDSYLPAKIAAIKALHPASGSQFIFITDTHIAGYTNGNSMHSHAMIDEIVKSTQIRTVINGGDILSPSATKDIIDYFNELREGVNYTQPDTLAEHLYVAGNHDLGANNTVAACLTPVQLAKLANLYSPAYAGVVYDETYPFQYYYDDTAAKIRYIVIGLGMTGSSGLSGHSWWDSYAKTAAQCAPFYIQALNSVPDNDYHVVVFNHIPGIPINAPYTQNFTNITNAGYITYLYKMFVAYQAKTTWTDGLTLTADFTDAKGVACCMVFGHQHRDVTGVSSDIKLNSESIGGTIPLFVTTTDNARGNLDPNVTRTAGTTSEQAFDVFTIDKTNRTINVTRVGGGLDRSANY